MGKNPAFQFYPNDWSRDLEEHPLHIEGAWIRICCKLWWSETRGELSKTITQWARILRTDENETDNIISYLENEKIADVHRNGNGYVTLMSRRMVRDQKTRELTRLRVFKHRNKEECNADVTPDVTPMKQPSSSSSSCTKVHIEQKPDVLFDLFWKNYPKKIGKGEALKAWKKIPDKKNAIEKMKDVLPRQKESETWKKQSGQYIPNPSTYLNQRRWEDETII